MSNRDSLGCGDLLPQDVVDIFAQEKHSKLGRKKRSRSLGRALGWLKGKKRKDLDANGQRLGLGPALDLALDGQQGGPKSGHKSGRQAHSHGNSHAVAKRHDDDSSSATPQFQENVFIEASRPKYLEDLHSEALEGLKMMQQEETNNGVEYQDNESTISTMTVQTDGEGGGFTTDSTIPDTSSVVSVQSSVSTRSSRSGLTRQGSTFRPLNSGKQSEKAKTRRRHRKTVAGIPRHVQRELGLDRVGWALTSNLEEEQLFNGGTGDSPTTDGIQNTADSNMNVIKEDQIEQLANAAHRDDLALLHRLGPDFPDGQRRQSLAVPSMTTANSTQQELPSPVMSMSPQAAYMSKIIPNAVLPPSIDVVEISRGRSRNSVRTVSKSSLLLSSPAPSRASSRASFRTTSSKRSNMTSASQHNPHNMSDSSCWSNSESSETLVSDSSTISSSSTPIQKRSQDEDTSANEDTVVVQASTYTTNGKLNRKGNEGKREGPFARSLSVMKPKRAPPPPSRSFSLHNKAKRRSRDLAELKVISGESSLHTISASVEENEKNKLRSSPASMKAIDSPGYNGDTSSLDDSTGSASFHRIKSQLKAPQTQDSTKVDGTVPKDMSKEKQESPQKKIVSPSSGYSSQDCTSPQLSKQPTSSSPRHKRGILAKLQRLFPGSSPPAPSPLTQPGVKSTKDPPPDTSVDSASISPSVRALRELFDIPPPPKVHAPPPPPPEVWAHNKRTFELLLGPPAPDYNYVIKKNPKDRRQQRQSPCTSTEGSMKSLAGERRQKNPTVTVESINGTLQVLETTKVQGSGILKAEIQKENNERLTQNVDLKGNGNVTEKDEKVRVSDILNGMLVKAVEKREERLAAKREEESEKTSTQASEVKTKMGALPPISLARVSPAPSPPPAHHPPQPSGKPVVSPESSWPPPPPPMAQVVSVPEDIDFPLPPPPLFSTEGSVPGAANTGQLKSSCANGVSVVKAEGVKVSTEAEPQQLSTSQVVVPPPVNIPPPPAYTAPPPPVTAAPLLMMKEIIPPPPKEISLPTIEEVPLSPPTDISPPPPTEFCLPPLNEASPVIPEEPPPPLVQAHPSLVEDISHTLVKTVSPPPVIEVSPTPPEAVSVPSYTEASPPPSLEDASQTSEEVTPVSKLCPPQTIPPPPTPEPVPPLQSLPPPVSVSFTSEASSVSCNGILTPPQSIPPPPPFEFLPQDTPLNSDGPASQELSHPEPCEASIPSAPTVSQSPEKPQEPSASPPVSIPIPPPLPEQGLSSILHKPSPVSTEKKIQESPSAPVVQQEEPSAIITPSILQMVKLRHVNSSPEPPKAPEPGQTEVTVTPQQPSNPVPTSSASNEAPQKPIRRSLIMTSPTSTSPPAIVTSPPALPKSPSLGVPLSSSPAALSPTKKSPPAMTTSPSMNLQEAIRLRTAARSKENPPSRLSLHLPTSPKAVRQSPTSTASFIFAKSNKVVMETKPAMEANTTSHRIPVKMPPPVAKKPVTKAKEAETGDGVEDTAGQEAQPESITETTTKTVAGTAEGGGT
ncbi:uncharacterized protein ACBR49_014002 [Aulostomus maculatus]